MKLKLDENLPAEATALLRRAGHDAVSVLDQSLGGAHDRKLVEICRSERWVLVTLDLDFSELRAYPPGTICGLIVLRLRQQDKSHVCESIRRIMPLLEREDPDGKLWIVDEKRVRLRG
ncbi:MAG: DUF5615 family PIN-like protein [Pyrinomonadaceae bacterium]